jgi:hypothetical protein
VIELAFAVAASGVIRRDVAERRRANREVERSERTLRSFYDSGVTMMGDCRGAGGRTIELVSG